MKTIITTLLVFVSLLSFSQNKIKLTNSSETGVFHNLVFEDYTDYLSLTWWGFPTSCSVYKQYYKSSNGSYNFNGKNYENFILYWKSSSERWEIYGNWLNNSFYYSRDLLGYFSGDDTFRSPECNAVILPETGIDFGGTLTLVNESGDGCTSSCTPPSTGPVISSTSVEACKNIKLTVPATCSSGEVIWYACPSGDCTGDPATNSAFCREYTGDLSKTYSSAGTYKYKVACQNACGTSAYTEVTITVNNPISAPTIVANPEVILLGENSTLTASGCNGTITWKKDDVDLGSGPYITVSPTEYSTYKATCTEGACFSSANKTVYVVTPPIITSSTTSICSGQSVTLSSSNCIGTVTWSSGGTGSPKTVYPTNTTTYTATCKYNGLTSGSSNEITVTVNPIPSAPTLTASPSTIALGQSSVLTATGCSGTVNWGNPINDSGFSKTVFPIENTTYSATCTENGCTSSIKYITVEVVSPPTISSNTTTVCTGGYAHLTTSGCDYPRVVTWSNGPTGSSQDVYPTSTTTYSATCTYNGVTSGNSNTITISIASPPAPPTLSASSMTINEGESTTITASGCNGTVDWQYPIWESGSTVKTVSPSITTPYHVACIENGCTSSATMIEITVIELPCDDVYEPNDTYSTAFPIPEDGWWSEPICINPASDEDWFKFDFNYKTYYIKVQSYSKSETGNYSLYFSIYENYLTVFTFHGVGGNVDTELFLYDSDGTTLLKYDDDSNWDWGGGFSIIYHTFCMVSPPVVTATSTSIIEGQSSTLSASGCDGTVNWSHGLSSGTSKTVSPTVTTTYTATCTVDDCISGAAEITITVCPPTIIHTEAISPATYKAALTIQSSVNVPGGTVYNAGNSITLLPGFITANNGVFEAKIVGCN